MAERETEMAREGCWGLAGGKIGKQADDWSAQDGGGEKKKMKRRKSEMGGGRGSDCKWGGTGRGRERWESGEKEGVGSREASDSSTAGRGPLNDSLFLHDFTS